MMSALSNKDALARSRFPGTRLDRAATAQGPAMIEATKLKSDLEAAKDALAVLRSEKARNLSVLKDTEDALNDRDSELRAQHNLAQSEKVVNEKKIHDLTNQIFHQKLSLKDMSNAFPERAPQYHLESPSAQSEKQHPKQESAKDPFDVTNPMDFHLKSLAQIRNEAARSATDDESLLKTLDRSVKNVVPRNSLKESSASQKIGVREPEEEVPDWVRAFEKCRAELLVEKEFHKRTVNSLNAKIDTWISKSQILEKKVALWGADSRIAHVEKARESLPNTSLEKLNVEARSQHAKELSVSAVQADVVFSSEAIAGAQKSSSGRENIYLPANAKRVLSNAIIATLRSSNLNAGKRITSDGLYELITRVSSSEELYISLRKKGFVISHSQLRHSLASTQANGPATVARNLPFLNSNIMADPNKVKEELAGTMNKQTSVNQFHDAAAIVSASSNYKAHHIHELSSAANNDKVLLALKIANLESNAADLAKELATAKEALEESRAALESNRSHHNSSLEASRVTINGLMTEKKTYEASISCLETDIVCLEAKLDSCMANSRSVNKMRDTSELGWAKCKSQNKDLSDKMYSLEKQIKVMKQSEDGADKRLEEKENLLTQIQDQYMIMQGSVAHLTSELFRGQVMIGKLETDKIKLQANNTELQEENAGLKSRLMAVGSGLKETPDSRRYVTKTTTILTPASSSEVSENATVVAEQVSGKPAHAPTNPVLNGAQSSGQGLSAMAILPAIAPPNVEPTKHITVEAFCAALEANQAKEIRKQNDPQMSADQPGEKPFMEKLRAMRSARNIGHPEVVQQQDTFKTFFSTMGPITDANIATVPTGASLKASKASQDTARKPSGMKRSEPITIKFPDNKGHSRSIPNDMEVPMMLSKPRGEPISVQGGPSKLSEAFRRLEQMRSSNQDKQSAEEDNDSIASQFGDSEGHDGVSCAGDDVAEVPAMNEDDVAVRDEATATDDEWTEV